MLQKLASPSHSKWCQDRLTSLECPLDIQRMYPGWNLSLFWHLAHLLCDCSSYQPSQIRVLPKTTPEKVSPRADQNREKRGHDFSSLRCPESTATEHALPSLALSREYREIQSKYLVIFSITYLISVSLIASSILRRHPALTALPGKANPPCKWVCEFNQEGQWS